MARRAVEVMKVETGLCGHFAKNRRLIGRGTEDPSKQQRRLETAKVELAAQDEFDYRVVNTDVAEAAREVVDLMKIRAAPSRP